MSWEDFYRRRDAIGLVLAHAKRRKGTDLSFDAVREVFADRGELAAALQYKWSQQLTGRIAVALVDPDQDLDHVEAVASAWRATARRHPELRALLDGYAAEADDVFHAVQRAEQRMLALAAGLAEQGEPADETARIGAAFLALIRSAPQQPPTRRRANAIEQLFRRLVASA